MKNLFREKRRFHFIKTKKDLMQSYVATASTVHGLMNAMSASHDLEIYPLLPIDVCVRFRHWSSLTT